MSYPKLYEDVDWLLDIQFNVFDRLYHWELCWIEKRRDGHATDLQCKHAGTECERHECFREARLFANAHGGGRMEVN